MTAGRFSPGSIRPPDARRASDGVTRGRFLRPLCADPVGPGLRESLDEIHYHGRGASCRVPLCHGRATTHQSRPVGRIRSDGKHELCRIPTKLRLLGQRRPQALVLRPIRRRALRRSNTSPSTWQMQGLDVGSRSGRSATLAARRLPRVPFGHDCDSAHGRVACKFQGRLQA